MPFRRLTTALHSCPRLLLLAGVCLWAADPGHAQFPKLPGAKPAGETATAKPAAATPEKTVAQLTRSLEEARQQLDALNAVSPGSIPEGITPVEVSERRSDLARLAFNLERHLKSLEAAEAAAATAVEAKRREQEWKGFKDPPPYSFLLYDELRNQRDAAVAKIDSFRSTTALIGGQLETLQENYREAEEAAQLAADKAARAKGTAAAPAAQWRLASATIHLQAVGSSLAFYQLSINSHQPRLAASTSDLALVERQLAAVGNQISFTDEDLAKATANARTKITAAEAEMLSLSNRQANLHTERNQLRGEIEKLRQQPAEGSADSDGLLAEKQAKLQAVDAEEEALSFTMDLLGAAMRLYADLPEALQLRRQLFTAPAADERLRARKRLLEMQASSSSWRTFVDNERVAAVAAVREQESKIAGIPPESPERAGAQRVLAAQHLKIESVDRLDGLVSNFRRSIDRWVGDDAKALQQRSMTQRAADSVSWLWNNVGKVWNLSVYSYSDTVEVNGQTVTVRRGLSLGWLLGALIFFFVSYQITAKAAKRIQHSVVQHGLAGEAQTLTLRRWAMILVGALLALFTLHLLKIPLTAFAFFGGALAIGFGFGTQTIFKNLISGIIVLAERKIKVGDILDVDGIVGKVCSVDTRSSTLRGFDGVETLIPNSLLLENKVTNWTHSNARQRRVVRVGVSYGSPLQRVAEIMTDCAERHGLVLSEPPPLVLFEDFGADSLLFALYFWVELKDGVNANQIASDLRFMLDKRFGEGGISIAFPQRDLHLTSRQPLEVRMMPPGPVMDGEVG